MQTVGRSIRRKGQKTAVISFCFWVGSMLVACTSARESPPLEVAEPRPAYRATPTMRDMNEQASQVNQKKNIEDRNPNAPANQTPEVRTQKILPGRVPVAPDTIRRPVMPPRVNTTGGEQ